MRRGLAALVVVVAIVVAIGGVVAWRCRGGDKPARSVAKPRSGKVHLDYAAIRRERDARIAKARSLVARYNPKARQRRSEPSENMYLVEPFCMLGPPETCLALVPLIEDCDDGQGDACLALAQYIAETPPHALIVPLFFWKACQAGLTEGCERFEKLKEPPSSCAPDDVSFECAWADHRSQDPVRQERACGLGFGEICLSLAMVELDDERRRDFLEQACQHEARGGCFMLGRLLSAECDDGEGWDQCLPTDEESAAEARALACEGGFPESCW